MFPGPRARTAYAARVSGDPDLDERYLPALRVETARLAEVVGGAAPELRVPSCPDWDLGTLARHVGRVHRWATAVVRSGAPVDPSTLPPGTPDDPAALPAWLREGAAAFEATVSAGPLDRSCWAWGPDQRARFWARRMAHETFVHRVDAELAAGVDPEPTEPALAADAIAELFENAPAVPWLAGLRGAGATIHLHATDTPGEWLVWLGPDGWSVRAEHAKADVALRGPAAALLLALLGRRGTGDLEVLGDAAVFARFVDRFAF